VQPADAEKLFELRLPNAYQRCQSLLAITMPALPVLPRCHSEHQELYARRICLNKRRSGNQRATLFQ